MNNLSVKESIIIESSLKIEAKGEITCHIFVLKVMCMLETLGPLQTQFNGSAARTIFEDIVVKREISIPPSFIPPGFPNVFLDLKVMYVLFYHFHFLILFN